MKSGNPKVIKYNQVTLLCWSNPTNYVTNYNDKYTVKKVFKGIIPSTGGYSPQIKLVDFINLDYCIIWPVYW